MGSREPSPSKEKIQIVPLYSVFAFPHRGIDTWTPEPSRPMPEPGRQERAPGAGCRARARVGRSGPEWPRQRRAGRRLPERLAQLRVPRSVPGRKQTEQQVLCEILGLELFFFLRKRKKSKINKPLL